MNKNLKEVMYANSYTLISALILNAEPFRLVLWNNNDWDMELPESVMKSFPEQLVIDIKDQTLKDASVDENNNIIIKASFSPDVVYTKILSPYDVLGVLSIDNKPLQLNSFKPDEKIKDMTASKEKLFNELLKDKVPEDKAIQSINAFAKNNPNLIN